MWSWTGVPTYGAALVESDNQPFILNIDIKVKRIVDKRQRLVLTTTAGTTARLRSLVNIRALIRESAGS